MDRYPISNLKNQHYQLSSNRSKASFWTSMYSSNPIFSIVSTYSSHSSSDSLPFMNLSRISSTYFSMSAPVVVMILFSSSVYVKDGHTSSAKSGSSFSAASLDSGVPSDPLKYSSLIIPG